MRNSTNKPIGSQLQEALSLQDAVEFIGLAPEILLTDLGLGKIQAKWSNREWLFERGDLGQYFYFHYHSDNNPSFCESDFILPTVLKFDYDKGMREFVGARVLPQADFSSSILPEIDLACCFFIAVSFENANLSHAIMYESSLNGSVFKGANLTGAWLQGSDLRGCDFTNANLTDCNLSNADIGGADFTGAKFQNTRLWPKITVSN